MNPVAAASGDMSLLIFALSISGVIIFLLGSLLWWLIKERMRSSEREKEITHTRLNAGNRRFEEQEEKFDRLKDITTSKVSREDCEKRMCEHKEIHKLILDTQRTIDTKVVSLCSRVDTGFKTMTDLLSSKLTVGLKDRDDDG